MAVTFVGQVQCEGAGLVLNWFSRVYFLEQPALFYEVSSYRASPAGGLIVLLTQVLPDTATCDLTCVNDPVCPAKK